MTPNLRGCRVNNSVETKSFIVGNIQNPRGEINVYNENREEKKCSRKSGIYSRVLSDNLVTLAFRALGYLREQNVYTTLFSRKGNDRLKTSFIS